MPRILSISLPYVFAKRSRIGLSLVLHRIYKSIFKRKEMSQMQEGDERGEKQRGVGEKKEENEREIRYITKGSRRLASGEE